MAVICNDPTENLGLQIRGLVDEGLGIKSIDVSSKLSQNRSEAWLKDKFLSFLLILCMPFRIGV